MATPTVKKVNPGVSGSHSLLIPITNIYDESDYTAQLLVGSNKQPVNVILDTGSSTFALTPKAYKAATDTDLKPTTLAQMVMYGTGGWVGPVINTTLVLGDGTKQVTLQNTQVAVTYAQQKNNFVGVDGIMGLAYNGLNTAFDFKEYIIQNRPNQPFTHPWPFPLGHFTIFVNKFTALLKKENMPQSDIIPYFTQLAATGVVANKFAFYTKRSWIHKATTDVKKIAQDPLNHGIFVLGGGEEQTQLYTGDFIDVDVQHDVYYNTNLVAVQVGDQPRVNALPLQDKYAGFMISNSVIDTGTSNLSLSQDVYQAIINSLKKIRPDFIAFIEAAAANGIVASNLNFTDWPDINFILTGISGNEVTLTCKPETYWQVNYPIPGMAAFKISGPPPHDDANQSVFGLPLMNNYYTVFDRSLNANGIIRFATIK